MSSVPPPLPVRPAPRHWLRVIAWPLAIFLSVDLIVLWFLFFESRRQLATYRAELKARGEPLTFAELLPPPVADQDNFFADPLAVLRDKFARAELQLIWAVQQQNWEAKRFGGMRPREE